MKINIIGIIVFLACAIPIVIVAIKKYTAKNKEVQSLVKEIFPDSTYEVLGHFSKEEYDEIDALKRGTVFQGGDLIRGKTKQGFDFKHTQINTYTSSSGASMESVETTSENTIFNGSIFTFHYPKYFSANVSLRTNSQAAKRAFKSSGKEKIETENVAFNEKIDVYSNDIQTTFYILTPPIMEKLMELSDEFRNGIVVSFVNNNMNIALPGFSLLDMSIINTNNLEETKSNIRQRLQIFKELIDLFDLDSKSFI